MPDNLYAALPPLGTTAEQFTDLLNAPGLRIERILASTAPVFGQIR